MNVQWLWWIGLALVFAVVEMLTVNLLFAMLAGGAVAGAIAGILGAPVWGQVLAAAAVALLLLVGVRPWALRKLHDSTPEAKTGVDATIGQRARVVAPVTDKAGRVKLRGEVWTARLLAEGAGRGGEKAKGGNTEGGKAEGGDVQGRNARGGDSQSGIAEVGTDVFVVRIEGATAIVTKQDPAGPGAGV